MQVLKKIIHFYHVVDRTCLLLRQRDFPISKVGPQRQQPQPNPLELLLNFHFLRIREAVKTSLSLVVFASNPSVAMSSRDKHTKQAYSKLPSSKRFNYPWKVCLSAPIIKESSPDVST